MARTGADVSLSSQLRMSVLRLSRRLRQQAVGDITASQLSALATTAKYGELTLGELAAIERVAPPSMTRIAARLEERGWLERRVDASDRRVALVAATPAGIAILDQTRTRRDAYLTARLLGFEDHERDLLARAVPLLDRLASGDD